MKTKPFAQKLGSVTHQERGVCAASTMPVRRSIVSFGFIRSLKRPEGRAPKLAVAFLAVLALSLWAAPELKAQGLWIHGTYSPNTANTQAKPAQLTQSSATAPDPAPEPAAQAVAHQALANPSNTSTPQAVAAPAENTAPSTAAAQPAPVAPAPSISPGEAAMEQHTRGQIIQAFRADNMELKTALAMFASENNLNIVPDKDISGTVTLDVHNLPLDEMMRALLEANDCTWQEENGLIRVRTTETRTFAVDYLRLRRQGMGNSTATLSSASVGGAGGGGGGGGGAGGGGAGGSLSSSTINVTADNVTDFWTELRAELTQLLTDAGRNSLAINKTAGIIEVTDRPSALKKVEHYLNSTEHSVNRQVDIEAKLYDVTLNDEFQYGINWDVVANYYAEYSGTALNSFGGIGAASATLPLQVGQTPLSQTPTLNVLFTNAAGLFGTHPINSQAAVQALKTQGNVEVLAKPRIRALNNQTAVIEVGEEVPIFTTTTSILPGTSAGTSITQQTITANTITIGTIMYLTPQISDDGWISLDVTPVLSSLKGVISSQTAVGVAGTSAADTETKQASTLVRMPNNTTVVLGGLIQTEKDMSDNKIPLLGDIPFLGKALFSGTYRNKSKTELVIFLTPHIVPANETSVASPDIVYESTTNNIKGPMPTF